MIDASYDVVIAGAGHGGSQAAITLRQAGSTGNIAMLSEEAEPPHRLVADVDATLEQQIFNVPQRLRKAHVDQHHQPDHLC